jgi:hypothetical protein
MASTPRGTKQKIDIQHLNCNHEEDIHSSIPRIDVFPNAATQVVVAACQRRIELPVRSQAYIDVLPPGFPVRHI